MPKLLVFLALQLRQSLAALFRVGGVDWLTALPDLCIRELCLTDGDVSRDVATRKSNPATTGMVLPAVGIACLGAILFGYHLGYFFLL